MKVKKLLQNSSSIFAVITATILLKPSFIHEHHFVSTFQVLNIQSSKDQPPRIALIEVNDDQQASISATKKFAEQINLNEIKIDKGPLQRQVKKISLAEPIKISRADFMIAAQPKPAMIPPPVAASREIASETTATITLPVTDNVKKYNLTGNVELSQGLSFGPDEYFEVRKVVDGVPQELGKVDIKNGTFNLPTDDKTGTVSVALKDKDGETIGLGSYHLDGNSTPPNKIVVNPTPSSMGGHIASIYNMPVNTPATPSLDQPKTPIAQNKFARGQVMDLMNASSGETAQTDRNGNFEISGIHRNSWTLLKTEATDFYPGIYIQGNKEKNLPAFPSNMIAALKDIVKQQRPYSSIPENGSVVWGRVVQDGKPVRGVNVQAEISDEYKAVYFNALMLPDPELNETSDNGLFAIMDLPQGWQSLVAKTSSTYFSHANTVVDEDNVSYVEIEANLQKEMKSIQVYDAMMGTETKANVYLQTSSLSLEVKGRKNVYLPPIHRISIMKAVPLDPHYMETYQVYSDDDETVQVPMIEGSFFQSLHGEANVTSNAEETATVIGFVQGDDFTVMPTPSMNSPNVQVVYFDYSGSIVPTGRAGGGFAIFGIQSEVNSVVIKSERTQKIYSQLIPLNIGMTGVLKYNFD